MKVQDISLIFFGAILLVSIITYKLFFVVLSLIGIMISGWGYLYPDKANIAIYKIQSKIAKDKLLKQLINYEQQIKSADEYFLKFAKTFDAKLATEWCLDYNLNLLPIDMNEYLDKSNRQLKETFSQFKELLEAENLILPDEIIKIIINYKVDELRYTRLKMFIDNNIESDNKITPKQVVKTYVQQIGHTTAEQEHIKKVFTTDYLIRYLVKHFSQEDLLLQLNIDFHNTDKLNSSMVNVLQDFAIELERERRINTMRKILNGEIEKTAYEH